MRFLILVAAAACAALGVQAQAQAPLIGQSDVARPGGFYVLLSAPDAAACARLCAEDSICMAWTFRAPACELKAVVPAPVAERGAISGLSARAPDFVRRIALAEAPEALTAPESIPDPAPSAEAVSTDELLGGPAPSLALRPRLGADRP